MGWIRVSPGIYKDSKTGEIVRSKTPPKDKSAAKRGGAKKGGGAKTIPGTDIGRVTSGTPAANRAMDLGLESGAEAAEASNRLMNPNEVNPFGKKNITYDENGRPTVTTTLSDDQQKILDQGESLTQQGQQLAAGNLGGYSQYKADTSGMGKFEFATDDQARQRIEQAIFDRLSRGMDTRHKNQSDQKAQDLYNRGIQFSNDPNSRYQQEMQAMQQGQQEERQSYQQQAVGLGGQEMQRNYDMSSGAYNTNLGGNIARNEAGMGQQQQMMSDTANLQGMGTGLMVPNFQEFQGNAVDPSIGASTSVAIDQLKQQKPVDDANAAYLRSRTRPGSGGSSSGGTASNPSPFG